MIREGSAEKNLEELLPLVNHGNYHRCMLVVDDRNALDILKEGDVDAVVRKAIRLGLDPVRAIQMASLNVAEYFRLEGLGGIAPGYHANMMTLRDLESLDIEQVYYRGRLVAENWKALFQASLPPNDSMTRTMRVKPFAVEGLALKSKATETYPVIEIIPGQIVTRRVDERPSRSNGSIVADAGRDLLKLVVMERHHATGNVGIGLVKGFGLKRGALATSVAHDSHNNSRGWRGRWGHIRRNQGGGEEPGRAGGGRGRGGPGLAAAADCRAAFAGTPGDGGGQD